MEWLTVESSLLSQIAYQGDTLHVKFIKGGEYSYLKVPADKVEEMKKAKSVGGYFLNHIKGHYDYVKSGDVKAE